MSFTGILHVSAYASNTIWSNSAVPATASVSDSSALELGVKFRSDVSGSITGIRFYKGSTNTGTHVGHLWTSTGALLATATFTNETASGWQQVMLSAPVAVTANTTYIASYYAPKGNYSLSRPYFTTGYDNPPLHVIADGTAGPNGVYFYPGSGFPISSYQQSNYWVDVAFSSSSTPSSGSSVAFTSVSPQSVPTAGGSVITMTGSNFKSGASVNFGGTNCAAVTFISGAQLNAMAPPHAAGIVNIAVTNPDGTNATLSGAFTYSAAPTVSSISPSSGPTTGGTPVTIFGTVFQNGAIVSFGAVLATSVNVISATQIQAVSPVSLAGTVNIAVLVSAAMGTGNLNSGFTFFPSNSAPTISSSSPPAGNTGTVVTITGTNFVSGAIVNFGSTRASSVTVLSATQISAIAPYATAGAKVNISVTNPNGLSAGFTNGFFYGQGLLTGMTPSHFTVPAGWTLVQAVGFEDGTPGQGASFNGAYIECGFAHSGGCAATHKVVKGDDTGEWDSQSFSGTKDVYISWWEYDEAGGSMGTDLGMAGVRWPTRNDSYWIDPNQPYPCTGNQYPSNVKTNQFMLIYGVGGYQTFGSASGCLATNAPNWGTWTQWEYRIKINDPTAWPNASNGEYQLYQNGVLVASMAPFAGRTNSGDPNPSSNMVGTADYTLYPHNAWVGGVSTYRIQYKDTAHTQCSTSLNGSDVVSEVLFGSFSNPHPCWNQAAPNGWAMNSIAGGLNRYWDDIIVIKK
jgi:hypothetical protein